jgi:hypothetical protein
MNLMFKIIIHGHLQGIRGLCKIKQSKAFKQNSLKLQLQTYSNSQNYFTQLSMNLMHEITIHGHL